MKLKNLLKIFSKKENKPHSPHSPQELAAGLAQIAKCLNIERPVVDCILVNACNAGEMSFTACPNGTVDISADAFQAWLKAATPKELEEGE